MLGATVQDLLERYKPSLLARYPDAALWLAAAVGGLVGAIATIYLIRKCWRKKKGEILPPNDGDGIHSHFATDKMLRFRQAESTEDILALERTEDFGGSLFTDLEQVIEWWECYPRGNFLAVYGTKVIGGMDIWPLKRGAFDDLCAGKTDESGLGPKEFALRSTAGSKQSYWYVGAISMEVQLFRSWRAELVARLIVNAVRAWLAKAPLFPAHFVALAWTVNGKNLLERNGFQRLRRSKAENVYVRTFKSEESMVAILDHWSKFLDETPSSKK